MKTTTPYPREDEPRTASVWLLISLTVYMGIVGCSQQPVIPLRADQRDADVHNRDYFVYAVENLDQLSEFGPNEILAKIVSRLNQWAKTDVPKSNWQLDPLIATLPESMQSDALLDDLSATEYLPYDGAFLREAVLLRNISRHVSKNTENDLEAAQKLFDWTVANIALDGEPTDENKIGTVQMPWQSILFGHGRAIDRAWVFSLLARQQNLDVVMLYAPVGKQMRLWSAGLVTDGQIYLFDPMYGVPIPGPTPGSIATLEEVATDASLLSQLDRDGSPYPFTADDVGEVDVYIEGSRQYLSERMKHIQSRLTGDHRLVLTEQPSLVAEKVAGLPHTSRPRLWPWPFAAEVFFADPSSPNRAAVGKEMRKFGKFVTGLVSPLWAGRMQQFAANYTTQLAGTPRRPHDAPIGEKGAKPLFLKSRTLLQRAPKETLPQDVRDQIEAVYEQADVIRRDGSFWLGMIAMDENNYDLADFYFVAAGKLQASPQWPEDVAKLDTHLVRGRAMQAAGNKDAAIEHYLAVTGPAAAEALFRAKGLAEAAGKPLSSYQPAKDPDPEESGSKKASGTAPAAGSDTQKKPQAAKAEEADRSVDSGDNTK